MGASDFARQLRQLSNAGVTSRRGGREQGIAGGGITGREGQAVMAMWCALHKMREGAGEGGGRRVGMREREGVGAEEGGRMGSGEGERESRGRGGEVAGGQRGRRSEREGGVEEERGRGETTRGCPGPAWS